MRHPQASAIAAILFVSSSPPQWVMSGWMICAAPSANKSRNWARVCGRSPVATGRATLRAPQKPIHRLAERLADDVPACHLHDGDGGHLGGPGNLIIVADDPQQEVFDVEGIAPQDIPVGDRLEIRGDGLFPIDRARLADAFESFVGPKPPEHKIPPRRAHGVGLDLSDPHRRPPLRGSSIVILSGAARASPVSSPRHPSRPSARIGSWL